MDQFKDSWVTCVCVRQSKKLMVNFSNQYGSPLKYYRNNVSSCQVQLESRVESFLNVHSQLPSHVNRLNQLIFIPMIRFFVEAIFLKY